MIISVCAVLSLALILCFRAHIDQWAFSRFLLSPSEDNLSISVRSQRLEQKNADWRSLWVKIIAVCISTNLIIGVFDLQLWSMMLIVIPCAAATSSAAVHAEYGLVNQVIQVTWLIARFVWPNAHVGCFYQNEKMLMYAVFLFTWNEVSLRSLSMLLVNHILVLASLPLTWHLTGNVVGTRPEAVYGLQTRMYLYLPVVSALMVTVFCYRRHRPQVDDVCEESTDAVRSRCAALLSLLLKSGDELCQHNINILSNALNVLTSSDCVPEEQWQVGPASVTQAGSAGGAGSGIGLVGDLSTESEEETFRWWFNASLAELARLDSPEAQVEPLVYDLTQDQEDLEPYTSSEQSQKQLSASPSASDQSEHLELEQQPSKRAKIKVHAAAARPEAALAQTDERSLASLSFNALAQIDTATGAVIWCNTAFYNLVHQVGAGDTRAGFQQLSQCREPSPPPAGSTETNESPSQLAAQAPDLGARSDHANQTPDLGAKIVNGHAGDHTGRRRAVKLWYKCGFRSPLEEVSRSISTRLERTYYKCRLNNCKARATADVLVATGEIVKVTGSGVHNHPIHLA